jgi:CRISPR-associated endonuclease Csn1
LPSQCYDLQGQEWHEALLRVRRFGGNAAAVKLERFQWTEVPDGFTNRHLQDTRYTSRLAGEYMGLLYGGLVDDAGKRRIQFSTGGVTAFLRNEWGLNGILNDGGFKSRDDHRHHAVDALTVALVSPDTVKLLSKAAEDAARAGRRRFAQISEPWTGFLNDVNHAVEKIVASHRPDHRVNGPLHNETNYSKPKTVTGQAKAGAAHHERKPLVKLSSNEVDDIVDNRIRGIVKAQLNGGDPKRVFADPKNLPVLPTRSGRAIPIRKARVRKGVTTIRAGRSNTAAYVVPGSNHHIAIIALRDDRDTEVKWEGHIVKRFDAMNRLRKGESVVQREWGPDRRLKFTLSPGDTVEMLDNHMRPQLLRVDSITEKEIEFRSINDARPSVVIRKITKARIRKNPAALQLLRARKVTITPLGEVLACND